MKLSRTLFSAAAAATLSAFAAAPAWAVNSLTFQGVTFSTIALDSDTLELTITNALGATGDWTGIASLAAFEIKDVGAVATGVVGGGWTLSDNALSANGCANGNTDGGCFTASPSPKALSNSMVFDIDFASLLDGTSPHLKVLFLDGNGTKTGSLLSQDLPPVPGVPEPGTYALMFAGLGVIGFMARRRKQQA